ncbi:hypothetical protein [Pseudomonas putida]|nr:hypothetical protein [Pseudomonas putida]
MRRVRRAHREGVCGFPVRMAHPAVNPAFHPGCAICANGANGNSSRLPPD